MMATVQLVGVIIVEDAKLRDSRRSDVALDRGDEAVGSDFTCRT
jgi:hypothetical protein